MVDSVKVMFDLPENEIHQGHVPVCELTDYCGHSDHHTSRAPHKCSCGKCSSVALFEHSCPLAYDPQTFALRSTSNSYYESANATLQSDLDEDGHSTRATLPTPGSLWLPILLRAFSCNKQQCFLYVRAHQRTSLLDDYGIGDLLHNKTKTESFNLQKEILQIQQPVVEQTRNSNAFTLQLLYPCQHLVIKTKLHLLYKGVHHNQVETARDPVDIANLVLLLLMMSGDVELNPGPPGTSKLPKN